jgi:hypothetical protein
MLHCLPSLFIVRKPTTILALASLLLVLLSVSLFFHQLFFPNDPNKAAKNVVMLTVASYQKLRDFKRVPDFYQKMWNNRMAEAHGNNRQRNS